jgi:O-antigen chain-terminating methyltransferase
MDEDPDLLALGRVQEEQDAAYNALLTALDAASQFPLPAEELPALPEQLARLNTLWQTPTASGGLLGGWPRGVVAPALERQQEFNATLVQMLNGLVEQDARAFAHLRALIAALMRYLQRVLPAMDARDRTATALATSRSELILEAFDRRQESFAQKLAALHALGSRLDALGEEVRALRTTLQETAPAPAVAAAAVRSAEDAAYVAFEGRFRGSREEVRERLSSYLPHFAGLDPVLDLGCGRGEFLDLLREQGTAARGVESNLANVADCRGRGLEVVHGDLLGFLESLAAGSAGGIFAAQVAEHLPPEVLQRTLKEAHRVLRAGGLLVLETVNPRSLVGFLEVYNRDLTHQRPLHPDTLSFLAAAHGFGEVRIELRSPVLPSDSLRPIPEAGLPESAAQALNENVLRLNALLYGPQEYALFARR